MCPIQVPKQEPGKLVPGGETPEPPEKDDDLSILDDDSCSLIDQMDGNVSVSSLNSSLPDNNCAHHHITVQTGYRPSQPTLDQRLPPVRRTIRRDNKVLQAINFA